MLLHHHWCIKYQVFLIEEDGTKHTFYSFIDYKLDYHHNVDRKMLLLQV